MIAPDIRTHMLDTYKWLRWSMAGVAAVFLVSLALYKSFGDDTARRDSISAVLPPHQPGRADPGAVRRHLRDRLVTC